MRHLFQNTYEMFFMMSLDLYKFKFKEPMNMFLFWLTTMLFNNCFVLAVEYIPYVALSKHFQYPRVSKNLTFYSVWLDNQ